MSEACCPVHDLSCRSDIGGKNGQAKKEACDASPSVASFRLGCPESGSGDKKASARQEF